MDKIAVIGIGRLGLCLALQLERAGYEVLGIDVRADYVRLVNSKTLRSPEPGVEEALRDSVHFRASHRLESLSEFPARLIFIAAPTPTAAVGGYDHSILDQLFARLYALPLPKTRRDVVVTATTLPGYCDAQAAEASRHGYQLSYKPEFIAQGSVMHDLQNPDQLIIGAADDAAAELIASVFSRVCLSQPAVFRMSRLSAEIAKLATNCFLTMKISFANAIGDLCTSAGAEAEKVLSVVGADTRIGAKFLSYGFGYGGPCFPRDNRALAYFAEQRGFPLHLSKATDEVNQQHLDFQVAQYLSAYGPDEDIHFTSVTYKAGTDILEESQALALALRLAHAGRRVVIHESEGVIERLRQEYGNLFAYRDARLNSPSAP